MPRPRSGESKKDYIGRFMESGEARSDFPDEKQRLAVAYSMYEKKNTAPGQEAPWPKAYVTNFIEPGAVAYQDLGPCKVCGDRFSCGQNARGEDLCQPEGATVLVKQEALARFAKSLVGKPLTIDHQEVSADTIPNGEADGVVTRVWLDPKTGWWNAEYLAWTPQAQQMSEDPDGSVSCAYDPTETDDSGGQWHSIDYASEILDGSMTHLALVKNPRYEGAKIRPSLQNRKALLNAKSRKGGSMLNWRFWEGKGAALKNAQPLNLDEKVDLGNGKEASFKELYDALDEPKPAARPKYNDDDSFETPKGVKSLKELKENYANRARKNDENLSPEAGKALDPTAGAAKAEPGHSEHEEGGKAAMEHSVKCSECGAPKGERVDGKGSPEPLPDLRRQNDTAEEAAKKLDKETKEKMALELQQRKNAEDEAAKKKADDEMRQAQEKADKEKADALENSKRREAGRASFESLRNARQEHAGVESKIIPGDVSDRLEKGRKKYGSA